MEFLDEQGVQPCGHKAREKGILIKVFTSCKSNKIPTEYNFSMSGMMNDKNTGTMTFWRLKQLLVAQTTDSINSSLIRCSQKTIMEPCTLKPGLTWRKKASKVYLVRGKNQGRSLWHYVLLVDDQDTIDEFLEKITKSGSLNVTDYGQVLQSGWGKDPPNDLAEGMEEEYNNFC